MPDHDVVIVGAGPTGLVLAAELCRHGVQPRVIDQNDERSPTARAVAIHARTLEVLDQMGVAGKFLEAGHRIHGASVYAEGKRLLHFTFDEIDSPYPFSINLPQNETERILETRLNALGCKVERGITAVGHYRAENSAGLLLQRPGSNVERVTTKFLIGCDGAHSTVRHSSSIPIEGPRAPESYVTADVRLEWDRPDDEWVLFLREDGVLACSPMGHGRYRLIGDATLFLDSEPDTIRSVAESWVGSKAEVDTVAIWRVQSRHVAQFRKNRIFLTGDAAHVYGPAGGQGMNTGIQDAHNLAWKLALAVQGKASESLLDSYAAERENVSRAVLDLTDELESVAYLRSPLSQAVRNRLLPVLAGFDVFAQRLSRKLADVSLNYRQSPIVSQAGRWHSSVPAPGDNALDIALPDGTRLFDLLRGTQHTVLLFTTEHPSSEDLRGFENIARYMREGYPEDVRTIVVARREIHWDGTLIRDTAGILHDRYGAAVPCVYVIRPDGYVGFRGMSGDPMPVLDFFGRVFEAVAEPADSV